MGARRLAGATAYVVSGSAGASREGGSRTGLTEAVSYTRTHAPLA